MNNIEKKVFNGLVATSMVGGALSACTPVKTPDTNPNADVKKNPPETQTLTQEEVDEIEGNTQEQDIFINTEPTLEGEILEEEVATSDITAEITDEEIAQISAEQEEKKFNYSILDIRTWNDYEIGDIEKKAPGYVVEIENPTSLFVIPLRNDEFLDENREVEEIVVDRGMVFEVAEVRKLVGQDGEEIEIGLLANTYGAKAVGAIVMDGKDSSGVERSFTKENESTESAVAYVALADNVYPNKVYNTFNALLNISQYQDANGILTSGKEYSYLEMIGLLDPNRRYDYITGLTSLKEEVRGGGVCAMATGISSLVHQDPTNKIVSQWDHPTRYFQGPFSLSPYVVDATVQEVLDGESYDFKWSLSKDRYLKIDTYITPSGVPYSETAQDGIGGLSDVNAIFVLSFTNQYPEEQTERLQEKMNEYSQFRQSKHTDTFESYESFNYTFSEVENAINLIYNREDIRYFESEFEQKEYLQDLLAFQEAVNSYQEDPNLRLADYLKTTEWYANYKNNPNRNPEDLDLAIRMVSYTNIQGEPLQCVTYAGILPLLYPELNIQRIGGSGVSSAAELVNDKYVAYNGSVATGFGGLLVAGKRLSIDNYHPEDLFVTRMGNFGHVGAILAETTDEFGNKLLLVTDANRSRDGKIRFYMVGENSLDDIFGPVYRYIVRSAENHQKLAEAEANN
ncbi:MAG: hypothetical protein XD87_0054 [candidate division WS6 bacterium 36_33]|uniref:Uncharacterized protein n=1 Tax=candidate division WS6 bacterium 36_33 TaxID=1641388 RepID=A0A101GZT8_9BACT|nr:MAG: hypothetical protein XD87_0054 [candidate division WS6 bacterium 36_33]